jgi:hypothetical protein
MNKVRMIAAFIVPTFFFASCLYSQETEISEEKLQTKSINTPNMAISKALEYLGFEAMEGFSADSNFEKAELVVAHDDKTPFLHDRINDREIWKVSYKDIQLVRHKDPQETSKLIRTFDVYLDRVDGTLLKIESIYTGKDRDFAPEPSAESAEKQLRGSRDEYLDFASPDSSYVSFYDILNELRPRNFKQVKASLVMIPGRWSDEPLAVWFVTYRGTDPLPPKGRGADMSYTEAYNYVSFAYVAATGQTLFSTRAPTIERRHK